MGAHAKLSPSSRHRWQLCPGSVREEGRYPEGGTSSPAAIDGTHTHTLLEYCVKRLIAGLEGRADAFIGLTLKDHEGEFVVDAERAERVEFAMQYIRTRIVEVVTQGGPVVVKSEERVDPKLLLGRDDLDGTVDVQIYNNDVLEIIDYKDGMGVVAAKDNPQLEQYAFGAAAPFFNGGAKPPFKTIRLTVIQPKLREKGMVGIDYFDYDFNEFLGRWQQLLNEANATDSPEAPLIPGEKQCRYCAHGGNCTARTANMFVKAGIKFEAVETVIEQVSELSPLDLSAQKMREIVEALPMLRQWLDGVEEVALQRIQSGQPIPGLKVVRGRGLRSWALPEEQIAEKLSKMTVPKGEIWVTKLISPAQLEKLKWTKKDGTTKQLSAKQLEVVHNELVKKSEGKLTVVSAADDRPAVEFGDVPAMFADVSKQGDDPLPSWLTS